MFSPHHYTLYSLSILYRLWSQLYLQEERKEWTGQPCHNPCRVWYWKKGNEKNREDPRTKDTEHANGTTGVNFSNEKRVRVWCFIKDHGLDEETQALTEERKAQDV